VMPWHTAATSCWPTDSCCSAGVTCRRAGRTGGGVGGSAGGWC
jgi:hypothetical protein